MASVLWLRLYILALSLTGTLAQLCTGNHSLTGYDRYGISSQDQLDFLAQNCTSIDATFHVLRNYTGSFVLHNVTNITGRLDLEWVDWPTAAVSLEFPDLLNAKSMSLWGVDSLTKLSLPKLEHIETLSILEIGEAPKLEFPVLSNASLIHLQGNITSVSFPALKTVYSSLKICNTIRCYWTESANTTMDISFPVLERANELTVTGIVASLSAPELTTIGTPGHRKFSTISLTFLGDAKPVSFPNLRSIGYSGSFSGYMSSLSLPALRRFPEIFGIRASEPVDIELPVVSAEEIYMQGRLQSVSFPNLRNFSKISVSSTAGLNCGSFIDALGETVDAVAVEKGKNVGCYSYNGAGALQVLGGRTMLAITVVTALVEFL